MYCRKDTLQYSTYCTLASYERIYRAVTVLYDFYEYERFTVDRARTLIITDVGRGALLEEYDGR